MSLIPKITEIISEIIDYSCKHIYRDLDEIRKLQNAKINVVSQFAFRSYIKSIKIAHSKLLEIASPYKTHSPDSLTIQTDVGLKLLPIDSLAKEYGVSLPEVEDVNNSIGLIYFDINGSVANLSTGINDLSSFILVKPNNTKNEDQNEPSIAILQDHSINSVLIAKTGSGLLVDNIKHTNTEISNKNIKSAKISFFGFYKNNLIENVPKNDINTLLNLYFECNFRLNFNNLSLSISRCASGMVDCVVCANKMDDCINNLAEIMSQESQLEFKRFKVKNDLDSGFEIFVMGRPSVVSYICSKLPSSFTEFVE